ncbi:HalOD1 output domain-containing protein [Natrinema sp. SYSU A 869]|uniref:HalOD1 output domain-containing protein n=1 Tax=Natrinema sp. SYSU A 869 TaxID=2871694 RepID=UPI001CA4663E|nr:HalOD1 output domain-containing protein [Natrinema sp. SYSU A 869]
MAEELFSGRYTWSSTTPTVAVVNAIAGIEDVEPTDLSTALGTTMYEHINPEALDTVVTTGTHPEIAFSVDNYRVEINGNELSITAGGDT